MLGKLMSWYRLGGKINWPQLVQAVEKTAPPGYYPLRGPIYHKES